MFKSVAFFAYPVSDVARARLFYEETLRLRLDHNFRDQWLEYDLGGATLAIAAAAHGRQPGVPGGWVALEVDDFEAEVQRLKGLGVAFVVEPFATPVCRMAFIADPDGNTIVIHQSHHPAPVPGPV
jgi:predicted enzyme related to lactoylglutathione lyase